MYRKIITIIGLILLFLGCEKLLIKPTGNSVKDVFKTLWKNYDMYYSRFDTNSINWDSIYNVYEPKVFDGMTDIQLYNIMCQMLENLKGGHVWLISPFGFYDVPSEKVYKYYYNETNISKYLQKISKKAMFTYGKLNDMVGYISISTFAGSVEGYGNIDNILNEFSSCTSIVIDVRNNAGGDNEKAEFIAARFCESKRPYTYFKTRNGKKYSDFSKFTYMYIKPENNIAADKTVVLLTDNHTGSAGEDFTLMMRTLPNVTQIGDSTRGSFGCSPIMIELQNGWLCYVPNSLQYSVDNELMLDYGIAPDILETEIVPGKDLMIERALEILK